MSVCKSCGEVIRWVQTAKNAKMMPASEAPTIRDGAEPPLPGLYIDEKGNVIKAEDVPCKVRVYRTHWQDCPSYKKGTP